MNLSPTVNKPSSCFKTSVNNLVCSEVPWRRTFLSFG